MSEIITGLKFLFIITIFLVLIAYLYSKFPTVLGVIWILVLILSIAALIGLFTKMSRGEYDK